MTRDEARAVAQKHLGRERPHGSTSAGTKIRDVLRFDELQFRAPSIYGFPPERLRDCWIAYVDRPLRGLFSSEVILIDAATGEVLYAGSANDEG
jgi:hypothetical protein